MCRSYECKDSLSASTERRRSCSDCVLHVCAQVGDSGQEATLRATPGRSAVNPGRSGERRAARWLIAVLTGLLVGLVVLLYMMTCVHSSLPLSAIMAVVTAMASVVVCGLCRAMRCCAAVALPSLSTTTSARPEQFRSTEQVK